MSRWYEVAGVEDNQLGVVVEDVVMDVAEEEHDMVGM